MQADTVDRQYVVRVLLAATLIEIIGFGILFPIIPLLLTEPGSAFFILPDRYSIETGYMLLGVLIAFYPLGQFLSAPIMGQLSDRYGRRLMLQLSIMGTVTANILFSVGIITATIPLLLGARLLDGLTGGNVSITQAAVADVSETGERSKNFGRISAVFGIGFIIGPFLGGALSNPDLVPWFTSWTPFVFAAVLSSVAFLIVHRYLPETSPMDRSTPITWRQPFRNIRRALEMQHRRRLFGTNFFYTIGFGFFTSFISVFLIQQFGFDQFAIGNFFLYIGIIIFLTQVVLVPRFFDRFAASRTMPVTLFLTGFFVFLGYMPEQLWLFLAIAPFFAMFNGLTQVSIITLISETGDEAEQGLVLGINASLRALSHAIPAFLSGVAAALFSPEIPVLVAAIIIMATAIGYTVLARWKP